MRSPKEVVDALMGHTGVMQDSSRHEYVIKANGKEIGRFAAGLPEADAKHAARLIWNTWIHEAERDELWCIYCHRFYPLGTRECKASDCGGVDFRRVDAFQIEKRYGV